jgi:7,8-didemethyl-8-hydroxy-5-deazariboflavin synthase CofG subunit
MAVRPDARSDNCANKARPHIVLALPEQVLLPSDAGFHDRDDLAIHTLETRTGCENRTVTKGGHRGVELITYVPDFQVILTRRCLYRCGYCNFPHTPSPPPPSRKVMAGYIRTAARLGARQLTMTAGEGIDNHPEIVSACRYLGFKGWYDYLAGLCRQITENPRGGPLYPVLDVGPVPLPELRRLIAVLPSMRILLHSGDPALLGREAHAGAPHKRLERRLAALEDCGRIGISTVTGLTIGIGESRESWARAARAVSDLHARFGHIRAFVLRPFFPERFSPMRMWAPVTDETLLEAVRAVRATLHPDILLSLELQQRLHLICDAVRAGVGDLGPFRLGDGRGINFDLYHGLDGLRADLASAGIRLTERLPFVERFLSVKRSLAGPADSPRLPLPGSQKPRNRTYASGR